jgi:phenylacetate-CoA ligase
MGKTDRLYQRSPLWLQNGMVSLFGAWWHWLRFGGDYAKYAEEIRRRESFTQDQWQEFQQAKLINLLQLCVNEVPYYRNNWSQSQKESAFEGDLAKLPLLEKQALRGSESSFYRQGFGGLFKQTFHTSGTTGTPISTTFTMAELRESIAVREVRSANWAGVSFAQPRATFSGRMVEPDPEEKGHVFRYNAAEKQVYFSAFHLKPTTARSYVDALRKYNVVWMTGYAVSYYLLARYILEQKIEVPPLKAVITTSEKLTDQMRSVMEKAYGCKVYEEYSTVESALFASECEHGRLHVSPDVGIVEILRPDGRPCDPGEVGEVVATCLFRSYQPLIRFRLGDLAAWGPEPCECGREMPVIKEVVGRVEDVVTGPDGRQLVRFHGIFTDQQNIIEGQIIQETLTDFVVRLVPTQDFSEKDEIDVRQRMQQRLGDQVTVTIEKVDSIPRSSSGKFKAVISKVK